MGCQKCCHDYSFGPIIRANFVIHYVKSGKGVLHLDGNTFEVRAGQAFITFPNMLAHYKADSADPWNYNWVHFNGRRALDMLYQCGITAHQPIFTPDTNDCGLRECMTEMLNDHVHEYSCISNMYRLFQIMALHSLTRPKPEAVEANLRYVNLVVQYIKQKYFEQIRVSDIADYCSLNRSYLSKVFKDATTYSIQEYLINFRIKKARQLLSTTGQTIQYVAYSVGYQDPLAFSRIFRKETGLSPSEYRQKSQNNDL